jgi:thymidylate synthase (FAD)
MRHSAIDYKTLIGEGVKPQDARGVLPTDLKTEILVTTNLAEWYHIFKLRVAKSAHPEMRRVMTPLLEEFINLDSDILYFFIINIV